MGWEILLWTLAVEGLLALWGIHQGYLVAPRTLRSKERIRIAS